MSGNANTNILVAGEEYKKIPDFPPGINVFVSVTDVKTFESISPMVGQKFMAILASDSHMQAFSKLLAHSYTTKAQYVKWTGDNMQQVYVKKGSVTIGDGVCFGIDMNQFRKCAKANGWDKFTDDHLLEIIFDPNYKGIGVLHDVLRILRVDRHADLPDMGLEDLSVYIARWGGVLGKEKYTTAYNYK
jgi:hypothetical protein